MSSPDRPKADAAKAAHRALASLSAEARLAMLQAAAYDILDAKQGVDSAMQRLASAEAKMATIKRAIAYKSRAGKNMTKYKQGEYIAYSLEQITRLKQYPADEPITELWAVCFRQSDLVYPNPVFHVKGTRDSVATMLAKNLPCVNRLNEYVFSTPSLYTYTEMLIAGMEFYKLTVSGNTTYKRVRLQPRLDPAAAHVVRSEYGKDPKEFPGNLSFGPGDRISLPTKAKVRKRGGQKQVEDGGLDNGDAERLVLPGPGGPACSPAEEGSDKSTGGSQEG